MEVKSIREYLYKSEGEFSLLYDSLKEVNADFLRLLIIKEVNSKKTVNEAMLDVMKQSIPDMTEQEIKGLNQLTDALVHIIFKNIRECHKTIYG